MISKNTMLQEAACIIKTGFVVDEVSEESFYQNLLLGITKTLDANPCVNNINLKRIRGLKDTDIRAWESNNGVLLSEDLRNFYSSTNGFLYTYNFSYDCTDGSVIGALGKIEMNPLESLVRTYGYETKPKADVEKVDNKYKLSLSRESKVFEISKIDEANKVVLVYLNQHNPASIWMCIAHLGIPYWQFIVAPEGVPEWSREIFQVIAPGVLQEDRNLIAAYKHEPEELNRIDVSIFTVQNQFIEVENKAMVKKQVSPLMTRKKLKKCTKTSTHNVRHSKRT
ncbi:tubulin polyglutamylase complex subunit 2 isoform X3 [Aethina tumida]|uniref:tubulin polyglutamylase complex subunit 2 isoform X3 n=1 Tax=Aethina tumida TaxID=116153 RepID=UPI0021484EAF|nr:tubulin polyglutamylase complex subunit 2 isoform X3 [Aethina tumida]